MDSDQATVLGPDSAPAGGSAAGSAPEGSKPLMFKNVEACVDETIRRVGKTIVIGLCLGLGKPNLLANAFYRRAKQDPSLNLRILSALTLEKPRGRSDLERRFLGPMVERIFGDYPELEYIDDLRHDRLPPNVEIREFFMLAGAFMSCPVAQQNYINTNYTHAVRDVIQQGVNVITQIVAKRVVDGRTQYSMSCNTDTVLDIAPAIREQQAQGKPSMLIGVVNTNLPFMVNDAIVDPSFYDAVVDDSSANFHLFSPPSMSVSDADHMIGLHASTLVRDGGSLQIGIGSLGDAIVDASIKRHHENDTYREMVDALGISRRYGELIEDQGGLAPFKTGLYGVSEMVVGGFMHLYRQGILKRRVYDHEGLQRLLNQGRIGDLVTPATLDAMVEAGGLACPLDADDVRAMVRFGVFRAGTELQGDRLRLPDGSMVPADLTDPDVRRRVADSALGERLTGGFVLHGGFFVGPQSFYDMLKDLTDAEAAEINMTAISYVNQLYGQETLKRLQRQATRFCNTAIMATASGSVVSDGLETGQVISGVGGQYNFVAMAHALEDARSIIMVRSTRQQGAEKLSSIVYNYGHITIPRHLRDIVITEYGIADLRSRPDREVYAAMIGIADSRFQPQLVAEAKRYGKLPADYEVPPECRDNTPSRIARDLKPFKERGLFPSFPFGTDFTDEEIVLGKALRRLKAATASRSGKARTLLRAARLRQVPAGLRPYLDRMGLAMPKTAKERLSRRLVALALIDAGQK